MLNNEDLRRIKALEEEGIDVVVTSGGMFEYSTDEFESDQYCNHCNSFRLLPDPDPNDSFRDGDMKAVCLEVNGLIAGSLETPSEFTKIEKPLYCPKLGRTLNEDEQEKASKRLVWAKRWMK